MKLYIGLAGSGKSTAMLAEVVQLVCGGRRSALVVPENYTHETERRLASLCPDSAPMYTEVLSFRRLADRVFGELGRPAGTPLDNGGRVLVMQQALDAVRGRLTMYGAAAARPEFLEGLISAVEEFKSCMVTPDRLLEAAGMAEGLLGDKLGDLALILGAYEALCAQGAFDPADTLTSLAERLPDSGYCQGREFFFDSFSDFTAQELGVVEALVSSGCAVSAAFTANRLDEPDDPSGAFLRARRAAGRLRELCRRRLEPCELIYPNKEPDKPPVFTHLAETFFSGPAYGGEARGIELYEAQTRFSECELAAAGILCLVREEGYRYRDIAVVARSFEDYAGTAESVFERYGLPVYLSRMADILEKPVMSLITAAVETVSGGWEYDDIFRYLKTNLAGLEPGECDILENYVLKWNIRSSLWTREEPWSFSPRGFTGQNSGEDFARLSELNALRARVTGPLKRLREGGLARRTARSQAESLFQFIEDINLAGSLERKRAQFIEAGELLLAEEYAQLWDIVCTALDRFVEVFGEREMTQDEFARLFKLLLSQYEVGSIPVALDRVTLSDMSRLRLKDVRALFVLGADDLALPQTAEGSGVLTDLDRERAEELGLNLAQTAVSRIAREMDIIYTCMTMPKERLVMSYAAVSSDGAGARPSFVMKRVSALFSLPIIREAELGGRPRISAPAPCFELAAEGRGPMAAAAREYLMRDEGTRSRLEAVAKAVTRRRGELSRESVRGLYGRRIGLSASRVDKFYSCQFSFFMQYGLKARARTPAQFDAPEYGTFMHFVLENVCREVMASGGFSRVDGKELESLTGRFVAQYVHERLNDFLDKTARFKYLFNRLLKTVYAVVLDMAEELRNSDFVPLDFELRFGRDGELPPIEKDAARVSLTLSGLVDRVDGWEHDGKLYLRVVDYKTGKRSFDLGDIRHGMGLQMLVYLFALRTDARERYGVDEIVPAGVLYMPARDVIVSSRSRSADDDDLRGASEKELRRSGLILDDPGVIRAMERSDSPRFIPVEYKKDGDLTARARERLASLEQLGKLARHVDKMLKRVAEELDRGSVTADPYYRSQQLNACTYCEYYAACHFNEQAGDSFVRLSGVKAPDFWAGLEGGED